MFVPLPDVRARLTGKMRKSLEYAYHKLNSTYDWVLKGDDDTFVITENLKHFLSLIDPQRAVYAGFHLKVQQSIVFCNMYTNCINLFCGNTTTSFNNN